MEIEVCPLTLGESTHAEDMTGIDAHALERRQVRDRGDDEISGLFEAEKTPITA